MQMSKSILVAFATRTGSTKEVAEAIAEALRETSASVDLRPAREVRSLAGYRSVVLGAPLYMFHWHKDAQGFLNRHHEALTDLPVAVFALGPFHDEEKEWETIRKQLDGEVEKFPWLKPVAQEVFGGKFDPALLRFPLTLIPAMKKMPASDARNWDAIRAWARNLAPRL
jgi:menaquinone-dependent protoporphyrinogen oxidase